jgi:hypothetical protein
MFNSFYNFLVEVKKPGNCPDPGFGLCVITCQGDDSCPGNNKCCFNGCGYTCSSPQV